MIFSLLQPTFFFHSTGILFLIKFSWLILCCAAFFSWIRLFLSTWDSWFFLVHCVVLFLVLSILLFSVFSLIHLIFPYFLLRSLLYLIVNVVQASNLVSEAASTTYDKLHHQHPLTHPPRNKIVLCCKILFIYLFSIIFFFSFSFLFFFYLFSRSCFTIWTVRNSQYLFTSVHIYNSSYLQHSSWHRLPNALEKLLL